MSPLDITLENGGVPLAPLCESNCNRASVASRLQYTVPLSSSVDIPIAVDEGRVLLSVSVPSGAIQMEDSDSPFSIMSFAPVAESEMRSAINPVDSGRVDEFGSTLEFEQTVLSTAFRCSLDESVQQPLPLIMTVNGLVDMDENTSGRDICLATINDLGVWQCLDTSERTDVLDAQGIATGSLDSCNPDSIQAFVFLPAPAVVGSAAEIDGFWDQWAGTVIGASFGAALLFGFVGYVGVRLYRYRGKYHHTRDALEDAKDIVNDMEMIGGTGAGVAASGDVDFTLNPMLATHIESNPDQTKKYGTLDSRSASWQIRSADWKKEHGELEQEVATLKAEIEWERQKQEMSDAEPFTVAARSMCVEFEPAQRTISRRAGRKNTHDFGA